MRVVIPSVGYADLLDAILPAWQKLIPYAAFTVVTSPDDADTSRVASRAGARVLATDVWRKPAEGLEDVRFNKAAALDLGLGFGTNDEPEKGETLLSIDADVYPVGPWPLGRLEANTIYCVPRYLAATALELEAHLAAPCLPLVLPKHRGQSAPGLVEGASWNDASSSAIACLGYFQLWRNLPRYRFGNSRTAGKYDLDFRNLFGPNRAVLSRDFHVVHLGTMNRENWKGKRAVPTWS